MGNKNCDTCRNLDPSRFELATSCNRYGPDFHQDRYLDISCENMRLNGISGCEGCDLVRRAANFGQKRSTRGAKVEYPFATVTVETFPGRERCTEIVSRTDRVGGEDESSRCYLYTTQDSVASELWPGKGVCYKNQSEFTSQGTLEIAKRWLEECLNNHRGCQNTQDTMMPTRLIKVGAPGSNPLLVVSKGTKGTYVTLSHCWGSPDGPTPLTTTTATIEERKTGIPWDILPKTFQDAITVTRGLDLEYLWVDSLCIIQECPEDWSRESKLMQDVYANAVLNLSADASSNSAAGFGSRHPFYAEVQMDQRGVQLGSGRSPRFDSYGLSHRPDMWDGEHPLRTRAWVFQERNLSSRILHFCKFELAWECDTLTRCECVPETSKGYERGTISYWGQKGASIDVTRGFRSNLCATQSHLSTGSNTVDPRIWSGVVKMYRDLSLTYEFDRPVAIAGLAARAAQQSSMTYMAGLWKEHLPDCLLWCALSGSRKRATSEYPSRSWISMSEPLFLWDSTFEQSSGYRAVVSYATDTSISAGERQVEKLHIKGRVAKAKLNSSNHLEFEGGDGKIWWSLTYDHFDPDVDLEEFETGATLNVLEMLEENDTVWGLVLCEVLSSGSDIDDTKGRYFRRLGRWNCRKEYARGFRTDFQATELFII
ncbi:hypothetical protein VTL71DRAFT_10854 [Oculimacula yallundae]|uniref:Heterokaryon incompatibility domain-containing protein n=1 Tax=Oculimacula yallundae TaxID=86028 RepID=A0ABR4CUT1_9HELO